MFKVAAIIVALRNESIQDNYSVGFHQLLVESHRCSWCLGKLLLSFGNEAEVENRIELKLFSRL